MMDIREIKNYLYSLRFYILFSLLIFLFAIVLGWTGAKVAPEESKEILEEMEKLLGPIVEISSFWQFLCVFLNNALTAFSAILFGVAFGIFPLLCVFTNGEILGILAFLSHETLSIPMFLTGILPHGIIEIPVLILAGAAGIKIGKIVIDRIFSKKKVEIKKELSSALGLFLKILLPLLLIAAAIEIFITPEFFQSIDIK
jgi:stage II sporulation protein M